MADNGKISNICWLIRFHNLNLSLPSCEPPYVPWLVEISASRALSSGGLLSPELAKAK
jgi:hypothetical protein